MGSSNHISVWAGGCIALFGTPFLVAGVVLTCFYFNGYRKWFSAQLWVETPCWIESAELEVSHDDSTSYRAKATYRYEYQGRAYESSDVSLYGGSDNIGDYQESVYRELTKYAESSTEPESKRKSNQLQPAPFRCFVNPYDPGQAVIYRDLRWPLQAFMAIFALTFPALGAGLVFASIWGTRELRRELKLKEDFPEQPWRWKTIWSSDTIPDTSNTWQRALDFYTLWSGFIIAPLIATTAMSGAFTQTWYAWSLMIFVALWFIPATATWRGAKKRRMIGNTHLRLSTPFVEPGNVLRGEIELERYADLKAPITVQLICEKKVTTTDFEQDTTVTEIAWSSSTHELTPAAFDHGLDVSRVRVAFHVPGDANESVQSEHTEYEWRVEMKTPSKVKATFEVPVFYPPDSRTKSQKTP